MNEISSKHAKALRNVGQSLRKSRRFPRNVFIGRRSSLFFDSDRMFDGLFVEQVKALLDIDGGACACLVNLDSMAEAERRDHLLFVERSTTPDIYQALLRGSQPGEGWLHDLGRYGCTSDLGEWFIYCERSSEIAVIGLRSGTRVEGYAPLLSHLNASKISEAIERPLSYGFSTEALSSQWRDVLLEEYALLSESAPSTH